MLIHQFINETILNFENSLDVFEQQLLSEDLNLRDKAIVERLKDIKTRVFDAITSSSSTFSLINLQIKEINQISGPLIQSHLIFIQTFNSDYDVLFFMQHLVENISSIDLDTQAKIIDFFTKVSSEYLAESDKGAKILLFCSMNKDFNDNEFLKKIVLILLDKGVIPNQYDSFGNSLLDYLLLVKPTPKELICQVYQANPFLFEESKNQNKHPLEKIFTDLKAFEIISVLETLILGGFPLNFKWGDKVLWTEILDYLCNYSLFKALLPYIKKSPFVDGNELQKKCHELILIAYGVNHFLILDSMIDLGLKLSNLKIEPQVCDWICRHITKKQEFSKETFVFIEHLIELKLFKCINSDFSSLMTIIMNLPSSENKIILLEKIKKEYGFTSEILNLIKDSLLVYGRNTSERIHAIEDSIKNLGALQSSLKDPINEIINILCSYKTNLKRLKERCAEWLRPYSEFLKINSSPKKKRKREIDKQEFLSEIKDLFKLCRKFQCYDLLSKILPYWYHTESENLWLNDVIFNFILDKHKLEETKGSYKSNHLSTFAVLLENVLDVLPEVVSPEIKNELKILSEAFNFASFVEKNRCFDPSSTRYSQPIVDAIRDCNTIPLIIPAGCKGHAICILLERESDQFASVSICNSGDGLVSFHPHLSNNTLSYQTFITYKNIPIKYLQNIKFWTELQEVIEHKSSAEFYEKMNEVLKEGIKVEASTDPDDYELGQYQGSCTAQCIMACFRHYIRKKIKGSSLEKQGLYKYLKACILHELIKEYQPFLTKYRDLVVLRKQQIYADIQLLNLVSSKEQCDLERDVLLKILREVGSPNDHAKLLILKPVSIFERYSFFRNLMILIAKSGYYNFKLYTYMIEQFKSRTPFIDHIDNLIYKARYKDVLKADKLVNG